MLMLKQYYYRQAGAIPEPTEGAQVAVQLAIQLAVSQWESVGHLPHSRCKLQSLTSVVLTGIQLHQNNIKTSGCDVYLCDHEQQCR